MADLLYKNLISSVNLSPLSLPLNLSHHSTFSFKRFTPLQRRFSHSTLLASQSSQLHILSRSEHADGSVSFKFGDESEISQIVDDFDGGNDAELDSDDNDGSLAEQANVLREDERDSIDEQFVTDSVRLTEFCEDSVEDEPKSFSISTAKVENSSDSNTTALVENLSDSSSTAEVASLNDFLRDELKTDLNSTAQVENWSASVKYELKCGSILTAELENFSASCKEELKIESISATEVEDSTNFDTLNSENKRVKNVASTYDSSIEVMLEKGGQFNEGSEKTRDGENLECDGDEPTIISDTNFNDQALNRAVSLEDVENMVEEDSKSIELTSKQLDAGEILDEEVEHKVQLRAEPILNKEDRSIVESMSEQLKAEPIPEKEDEGTVEMMSKHLEAGPILDEEALGSIKVALAGHPSIANLVDEPLIHDISDAAPAFVEASGVHSTEANFDCLNKVETATSSFSVSSAVASLTHSLEALTGGKDAYFVSDNWFGVADGVGQWSFGGVDIGRFAHELMLNCEKLLNGSAVSGVSNAKELLQRSAAMTQSTGSARVITAHVSNQVLHVANIGDSGFLIIRNGTVCKKSSPMVHEFNFPYTIGLGDDSLEDIEEYHIELEDGDVIVTATDGLFDNLYEQEIAFIVSKSMETRVHVQDLAELLATKAQEVGMSETARSPFADAAQAAGHSGYIGGKFDHVTVIVSLVQEVKSSLI